jgi:hypothetical protein
VIIRSVCNSCFESYMVTLMPGDLELMKQISEDGMTAPCPRLCGGRININGEPAISELAVRLRKGTYNISGKELYKAVMGAGLPDEIPKDILVLTAMLKSNKIVKTDFEHSNDKFYLHELTLENGVTFHFSGGPRGAQLLKVTKPREAVSGS